MPTVQGESITDDHNDPPTASHFPQPLEEVKSKQPKEETLTCGTDQSEDTQQKQEEETSRLQSTHQDHVIKNVDEIFHTIEGLMSKLRQLKVGVLHH